MNSQRNNRTALDFAFSRSNIVTCLLASVFLTGALGNAQTTGSVISPVFTAASSVAVKPGVDSAAAIQLQSSTGSQILSVDSVNARVGIGTSSPSNRLVIGSDVIGATISPSSAIAVGNGTGTTILTMGQDPANRMYLAWNYNAAPGNAFMTLGAVGTQPLSVQAGGGYVGIGTVTPSYTLDVRGSTSLGGGAIMKRVATSASSYSLTGSDYLVAFTSVAASASVALPSASTVGSGQMFIIKDESGSLTMSNTLTITASGSDTIQGVSSIALNTAYAHVQIYSNGSNKWFVW